MQADTPQGLTEEQLSQIDMVLWDKEDSGEHTVLSDSNNNTTSNTPAAADIEAQSLAQECSVCLSEFKRRDAVALLPCGHLYHRYQYTSVICIE
jgi:hypothetical protein